MKLNKGYTWAGIFVAALIIWGLFGHFVCRIGYSTRKPINYDKPKLDTGTFDTLHSEIKGME